MSDPIDAAFANGGGDERFSALHGGMRECVCPKCRAERVAPIESRADLIAQVAAEKGVPVSLDRAPKAAGTTEDFQTRWAAVRAARRRQSAVRWR